MGTPDEGAEVDAGVDAAASIQDSRRPRRRPRGTRDWRRDHRYTIAFNDAEDAVVRLAATAAGMTPGAWAGDVVAAVARGEVTPLPSDLREVLRALIEARIAVDRIGTNLNQLTAAVNTAAAAGRDPARAVTGAQVDAVMTRVLAALARLDDASLAVDSTLRAGPPAPTDEA